MKDLFENVDINDILTFLREHKIIPKIINTNMISTIKSNYQKTTPGDFDTLLKYHFKKTQKCKYKHKIIPDGLTYH